MEFLSPSVHQIRHSIVDIDDSYNNPWDVLAELTQNAVDAIRSTGKEKGQISITINCQNNGLFIKDDGVGISPTDLPYLLAPFSSKKKDDGKTIGEKGVGLTFCIFRSNKFQIESESANGRSFGSINNAHSWKESVTDTPLLLDYEKRDTKGEIGTSITFEDLHDCDFFNLTTNQIISVLRTKTAIGNTRKIWGDPDVEIEVMLTHIMSNGEAIQKVIPFSYLLPTEALDPNSSISLDDFLAWTKDGVDRSDSDKRAKLKNKVIFKVGSETKQQNRVIKYFACFVPKRSHWDFLTEISGIATKDDLANEDIRDDIYYSLFDSRITSSVKGMPTGIIIDHPATGYSGYWSNIFIILEDPFLKFDIGRKSIHGNQAKIHKEISRKIFNEIIQLTSKYVAGEPAQQNHDWDRDELFAAIDGLVDLNLPKTSFKKSPHDQEASVAAIFFECVGNSTIKDITPLISGYRNKYDLYAKIGNKKAVIEFKARLLNICKDFSDAQKLFDEIDCIVCWDVSAADKQALFNLGIAIDEINPSQLGSDIPHFPSATHVLSLSGLTKPRYVIDLKKIISV